MASTKRELEIAVRVKDQTRAAWEKIHEQGKRATSGLTGGVGMVVNAFRSMLGWINRNKLGLTALAAAGTYFTSRFVGSIRSMAEGFSEAAAAAEELNSRFSVVFGDLEDDAARFGDTLATGIGRSRQEVRAGLADFGQFFEGLGFSEQAALDLSKTITQLGIDLASFFDQNDAETFQLLRSGLIGNAEALDRFGGRISAIAVEQEALRLGLARSTSELTEQQKVVARLSLLTDRWANAQGDAIRTAGSFTNQMKALRGVVADLRVEFGQRLNQAILRGLDAAGGVQAVKDLASVFFASVETLAEVGIGVGAQLAKTAADTITRLGGPEGVVRLVQLAGETAVTWIESVGVRVRAVVLDITDRIRPLLDAADAILPKGPTERFQELSAAIEKTKKDIGDVEAALLNTFARNGVVDPEIVKLAESEFRRLGDLLIEQQSMLADLEAKHGDRIRQTLDSREKLAALDSDRLETQKKLNDLMSQGLGPDSPEGAQNREDFLRTLTEWQGRVGEVLRMAGTEVTANVVALSTAFDQAQRAFRQGASSSIADTIFRIGEGAKSASEAFKDLGRSILYALLQQRLARGIEATLGNAFDSLFGFFNPASSFNVTGSAKGNVIGGGKVQAFAQGGILNSPIAFPMKNGLGIAGEAGPELIAPVKRMPNGDMGIQVQGGGGGGGQLNLTIQAVDARSVVDLLAGDSRGFVDLVSAAVARSPQLRGLLGGAV